MRPPAIVSNPFPTPTPFPAYVHRCLHHGCRMIPTSCENERGIYCPRCSDAA